MRPFPPQSPASVVQRRENFLPGPNHSGLVVRNGVGCTELLDYGANVLELVPRHGGEEMMLNLVIETTVVELRQATAFDTSCGYHLLS